MPRISQREARRLRARVAELERIERDRLKAWAADYPGGVNIATTELSSTAIVTAIQTARRLQHAVVVVDDGSKIRFYALPQAAP